MIYEMQKNEDSGRLFKEVIWYYVEWTPSKGKDQFKDNRKRETPAKELKTGGDE